MWLGIVDSDKNPPLPANIYFTHFPSTPKPVGSKPADNLIVPLRIRLIDEDRTTYDQVHNAFYDPGAEVGHLLVFLLFYLFIYRFVYVRLRLQQS
jgi:hypothetical protein